MLLANTNCQFLILNTVIQLQVHSKHCLKNHSFLLRTFSCKDVVIKGERALKKPCKVCYTERSPYLKGVKKNSIGVPDLQF